MLQIGDPNRGYKKVGGDEMLEMNHGRKDYSLSAMHSFIDDEEVGNYREGIFGQEFMCIENRNRRINSQRTETDLYRNPDRMFESRAESPDLYFANQMIPSNSVSFSRGENAFSKCNMFSSPDSVVAPNFTRGGMMRSELDLHQFLLNHRYGVNSINDDSNEGYLVRERGKNTNDKDEGNYVRLGCLSEKLGTPLDRERRRIDEQRFSVMDNQIKTNCPDCLNRSSTLNIPCGNDTGVENQVVDDYRFDKRSFAINEMDTGNVTRSGISPKYNALCSQLNHSSAEYLNTSFLDVPFSDCNRNHHTYVRYSSPMVVDQSVSLEGDVNPYLSHRNIYSPHMKTENRGYNSSECGSACIGSGKQRKSVFKRLTSSSSSWIQAKDTDTFDIDSSVDELMEIFRQGEESRPKKLERKKPAVQKLDNCPGSGNSDFVFVPEVKSIENSNNAVDGIVQETLTETRAVEFRRRREKNTIDFMCEKTQVCRDVKKENDNSAENAEPIIQQLDKEQPKRRKLVRPVFAVNNEVGGIDLNVKPS